MPPIPVVSASGAPGSCHLVPELAIEEVEDFDVPRRRVDGALVEGQLGVPWLRGTSAASTRQGRGERRGIASLPPGSATPAATRLFTPSDIRCVIEGAVRCAVGRSDEQSAPTLETGELLTRAGAHPRTIQRDDAVRWLEETRLELGRADASLESLDREVRDILGG
jgi:hypothetical protein